MKMKSNHPFVESPSPFCPLTIVNHHPSKLLLLLSRLVPHLQISSNVTQKTLKAMLGRSEVFLLRDISFCSQKLALKIK